MSEKEKKLIENIARLPANLRERFTAMAEGAAMAQEAMESREGKKEEVSG